MRKYIKEVIAFIVILMLFIGIIYAGGFWNQTPTWGTEAESTSDTLFTTGADTSSSFRLQVYTGTGRGYDAATEVIFLMAMTELSGSDSGALALYFEVSNDATTWYPYNNSTALFDTITSAGTAGQTAYYTKSFTTFNKTKYGRTRVVSVMPDDSAYVSKFEVNCKY